MRLSYFNGLCPLLLCLFALPCLADEPATKEATKDATKQANEEAKSETITFFETGSIEVPADFKRVPPKSRIVQHEFQATAGEGDEAKTARVYMMPSGGGVEPNIKRWYTQFANGDKEAQKTEELKLGKWKVHLVDVSGEFQERVGGGPFAGGKVVTRTNYAMTGAIFVNAEGRMYFAKMVGPESVVKANREAFVKMVKSIEK